MVDQSAKETLSKMLEGRQTDIKLVELSVRLSPIKEVGCRGKVVTQIEKLNQVNTTSEVHLKHLFNILHYDL